MEYDYNILTNILTAFTQNASLGYAYLVPDAMRLIRYFMIFEVALFGATMAFGKTDITAEAIKKLFMIAFFLWLIPNMHTMTNLIIRNFASAGLIAGGSAITQAQIFDPSAIVGMGLDATGPIFEENGLSLNVFKMIMQGITGLLVLFCYLYIAFQLFLSILEFYILSVVSAILIPFGLFKPLSYLYEKSVSGIFALAIRFMMMAFIVCLSYKTLESLKLPAGYSFTDCVSMLVAVGTIAFLCGSCTRLAATYFGGGGGMSGGLLGAAVGGAYGAMKGGEQLAKGGGKLLNLGKGLMSKGASEGTDTIRSATSAHINK